MKAKKIGKKQVSNHDEDTLIQSAQMSPSELFAELNSSETGKTQEQVDDSRERYGDNKVEYRDNFGLVKRLYDAFVNPFTLVLVVLAVVSVFTDIILADPGEKSAATVIIIVTMVLISGILKFIQETKSGNAAAALQKMIETTVIVERATTGPQEIPLEDVVVGDIVHLAAGDMIPADMRIIQAKDLFVSQSALTGESMEVEKVASIAHSEHLFEIDNLVFMGTNVLSGSAKAIVVASGNDTIFGEIAKDLNKEPVETSFDKGVNSVSWVLIKFMLVMIPIVFVLNGITKGDWLSSLLFSISIAVGLTPEMLPTIVTTTLAKGTVAMSKEKVIVKNLNSIQNLGAIDILCTDKTGTLTEDKVVLHDYLDTDGDRNNKVLQHAYLNSYHQTGLRNLMDEAILARTTELQAEADEITSLISGFTKQDEIPFDFNRRRMSVIVESEAGETKLITKGAVEEILSIATSIEYKGEIVELTAARKAQAEQRVKALNETGMRVVAVAKKTQLASQTRFSVEDESDMVLIGYLVFFDPPKESAIEAIRVLNEKGVDVKVLTGDNEVVTKNVCRQIGIPYDTIYLGSDIDNLTDDELYDVADEASIFAKMSPAQKTRVVEALRERGHTVGYLGDGINDASALRASDVGISVNNAVDIAKESADVILLEKDLMVLENGIIEGRKTYANMIKYIKITASSNFGNVFSVLVASAFLPFLPMAAIHLILLNLIYDISCIAIPWDNVDESFLEKPKEWDAGSITKFMLWFGPTSSIFDMTTYALMYFVIAPMFTDGLLFHQLTDPKMMVLYVAVFQAGWFIESMWSQTLIIHLIRTEKIPFIQSRASKELTILTFTAIILLTIIPFTSFGTAIGLASLPLIYFVYLALTVVLYMALVALIKKLYINRYGELL